MLHKPYNQLEAAGLYREIKQVMAEDAARRQSATQFSSENQPGSDGGGKFPPPSTSPAGKAREQAAAMIPGGASYKTLEKVGFIEEVAQNPAQPESLRAEAIAALARIEAGVPVHPIYQAIRESAEAAREVREATMHALAEDAVARAKALRKGKKPKPRPKPVTDDDAAPVRYPVRAFVQTWGELAGWWTHYDIDVLAAELTDEQYENFLTVAEATARFADDLRTTRAHLETPRLRAL